MFIQGISLDDKYLYKELGREVILMKEHENYDLFPDNLELAPP